MTTSSKPVISSTKPGTVPPTSGQEPLTESEPSTTTHQQTDQSKNGPVDLLIWFMTGYPFNAVVIGGAALVALYFLTLITSGGDMY